ncbi:hypothetical protein [Micromonospora sp. NPDC023956]|uniref:hypothetical protein n=1 Tax=Micromonospora sp. NPDC023956 TaxID=3155722 RepID=UPI0033C2378E
MKPSDYLAVAALAASLLSAIYTYRLSRQSHHVSTYYGAIGLFRELDKTFVEYPEMRPYFYEGKPVAVDDPNRQRVKAMAEMVLDAFEWIWLRRRSLNAEGEWGWRAYIIDTFSSSPALQQHYARSDSWYPGITRLIADCSIELKYGTTHPNDVSAGSCQVQEVSLVRAKE